MNPARYVLLVLVVLAVAGTAPGQGPLPGPDPANLRGDSTQTRKRLAEAEQKLINGKAADATDDLQRVLDEVGDDLITVDGQTYRPARWVAHGILARLPADALRSYQDRIDDPARKLLDAGKKARDPAPLWRLLDRYFVSRPSEEALLLLGDLLFERGDFRPAERMWRRLLPDADADIAYPASKTDRAAVQARIILAAVFQDDVSRARAALKDFQTKHPDAKGSLAGKTGPLADTLQAILDNPPRVPLAANSGAEWPTFGGGPDRSGRVAQLPRNLPSHSRWQATLPDGIRHPLAPIDPPGRPPFSNPVIANGQVYVTDGCRLFAFNLLNGERTADLSLAQPTPGFSGEKPPPEPCPTLTAAGGRVYVRTGPGVIKPPTKNDKKTEIVCLGPDSTGKLKEKWRLPSPGAEGKPAVWEGAPLVVGRRMWIAYARFEAGRIVHGIACYDPADPAAAPVSPAWTVDVCDSSFPGTDGRARHELLTLAGRNVVFCSNAGAVIALDAVTGQRAWGFRYSRARKADANRSPIPSPAVATGGRVFVAPTDADRVYALDPETGELLWSSAPTEGARIVGVSAGRLVVTVTGPVKGLHGLSLANGNHDEPGWVLHRNSLIGYGHGFVTDTAIVWPTLNAAFFLDPHDGSWLGERTGLSGNVAYADGVLVVVTPKQLMGYVSASKRFGEPDIDAQHDPAREHQKLIDEAEDALAAGNTAAARTALLRAARGAFPGPLRAWAAARLLMLTPKADDDLPAALAAELRDEWLIPPDGIPVTLGTLLDRHLGRANTPAVAAAAPPPGERRPVDVPSLGPDADVGRTARLAFGMAPLRWIPGQATPPTRIFAISTTELLTIPLENGNERRHQAGDRFTHAADIPDGFVAAGPSAVAVYGSNRAAVWVFRVPTTDPLPARVGVFRLHSDHPLPTAELSSFRVCGSWLIARLGERHLIAFDLRGRRVAWVLGADGKSGYRPFAFPGAARFGPEFAVSGRLVVVQLSDGRRWFVAIGTGKVIDSAETAKVWWPHAPAEIGPGQLAVADGPDLVRVLNLATDKASWTYRAVGDASLTGDPPQIRAWCDLLLIAVRRNHGVELDRVDGDGQSAWPNGAAFLDADRVNLANADADADRVYVPFGTTLAALALKEGQTEWEVELPPTNGAGGWVVRAGQKCVIVYPEAAIPREAVSDVLKRLARSFRSEPAVWRLPGMSIGLYDAWVTRTVPVLLFDPETGRELNRLDLTARGPAVSAWFDKELAVVATGDRVVWLR